MGRKSRAKRCRRKVTVPALTRQPKDPETTRQIEDLETSLKRLAGGRAQIGSAPDCPDEVYKSALEDVLAFESVGSGLSLFQGLEARGIKLPPPERLNQKQSARKVMQIFGALAKIQVYVVGFDHLSPKQAYAMLFHETLW